MKETMPSKPGRRMSHRLLAMLQAIGFAVLGGFATLVVIAILVLNSIPDLSVWHDVHLDDEFNADSPATTLQDYLAIEERVFAQLESDVQDKIEDFERTNFNRFNIGSRSDPGIWPRNWNRTYELIPDNARFGVLLLHGYSDSPYSLRSVGKILHEERGHVLGLRIPGHGTAPTGLVHTAYEDMAAAVRVGMSHLKTELGDRPLYIVGYSNGGALSLHYTLTTLEEKSLARPSGIILISPQIAVTRAAALARWQSRVGKWLGLDKLTWSSVGPEYDPFKYVSFAINAGEQVHRLTGVIQSQLNRLEQGNRLSEIPPILAFQSAVDSTVTARAVLDGLFDRLEPGGHHLVIFDINRMFEEQGLIRQTVDLQQLLSGQEKAYRISIVTNRNTSDPAVIMREREAGQRILEESELDLAWPTGVFSLSHVALPFPPNDPLYGNERSPENPGVWLGQLALRGENNILAVSNSARTRQHWNPFFPVIDMNIRAFVRSPISVRETPDAATQ